jgi:hypothetical protein
MIIDLPIGISFVGLDQVPEGLQQMIQQRDNQIHISLFGVEILINEHKEVGSYTASWNAANLSSWVYMYRIEVGSNEITKRMT